MVGIEDGQRRVVVRTELDGAAGVRLSVQDGGIGLKPDAIDKLFEAFYTTKPSGMGIGLAVSRSIVEAHGGGIWAIPNTTGPGATFCFSIPFEPPAAS